MSTRPQLVAEPRQIVGKKVASLRREGILPGVVYGHGHDSQPIQIDAHAFDVLRRKVSRNAILDLKVGGGRAIPVMLQHVHEHPVGRQPVHVDLFVVRMSEEMTVDVSVSMVGESIAVTRLGGTLLHLRDSVQVKALPMDLPSSLELDVTPLETFDSILHVRDLHVPAKVTLLTDGEEGLARVQPPRVEAAPVVEAEEAGVAAAPEAAADEEAQTESSGAAAPAERG